MFETSFAVVDVETTGFRAFSGDRLVEIAIIQVDPDGEAVDEYATLVNPRRDIGKTSVHGITSRDVESAPTFDEVAGDIALRLRGRVWIAHNARFEGDFLMAEYDRLGYSIPESPAVCTLRLARSSVAGALSYKLSSICADLGLQHDFAHSALGDARATAQLFKLLLYRVRSTRGDGLDHLGCEDAPIPPRSAWPMISPSGRRCERSRAHVPASQPAFLARLVSRLSTPNRSEPPAAAEYVDLLNRCLEDRRVTADEAEALLETAIRWGLSRDDVLLVHNSYLVSLVHLAKADEVITATEREDLREVSRLLGFAESYADELILSGTPDQLAARGPEVNGLTGLTVCFTGESVCTRGGRSDSARGS